MGNPFTFTFFGGKLEQAVTSITLVNNTAKTQDVTVPVGKRWLLLGVKAANGDDVTRTIVIYLYKEVAKTNLITILTSNAAVGVGLICVWPSNLISTTIANVLGLPAVKILEGGNTISVVWSAGGASTGAVDVDGLVVEYLEIDA